MNESNLHGYQVHAIEHILQKDASGIFMDMGLGKSVCTLTAISRLLASGEVKKVLVVAPKRVAEHTWTTETAKWDHLQHLRISKVIGKESERKAALKAKADIYVTNRENVVWLIGQYGTAWPFDMLVIDESSSFKSPKAARFKALRQIRPRIKRVVLLTGTPAPNGLLDLWAQLYLLDQGERLGKTLGGYRETYFNAGRRNGHVVYEYELKTDKSEFLGADIYQREIYDKIGDICISMKSEDWLTLPELIDQKVDIILPPDVQTAYDEFEKWQVLSMEDVEDINVTNAAALCNKLRQFANGAVYTTKPDFVEVHNAKLEALEEDLEAANGQPFLLFYQFRHDLDRIKHYLKHFSPKELKTDKDINAWNRREIPFMLVHGASGAYGLNLQEGGNLMGWYGRDFNSEIYRQAIKRLHRQGQRECVIMRSYIAQKTIAEDIVKAVDAKISVEEALLQAVKARVRKYKI